MTTLWTTSDVARAIERSTPSVTLYARGIGVHTPPPVHAVMTTGTKLYHPDDISAWWADEMAIREGRGHDAICA